MYFLLIKLNIFMKSSKLSHRDHIEIYGGVLGPKEQIYIISHVPIKRQGVWKVGRQMHSKRTALDMTVLLHSLIHQSWPYPNKV